MHTGIKTQIQSLQKWLIKRLKAPGEAYPGARVRSFIDIVTQYVDIHYMSCRSSDLDHVR